MKMIYQKKDKSRTKKRWFFSFLFLIIILLLINFSGVLFPQKIVIFISKPLIKAKEFLLTPFNGTISYFSSKKSLWNENEELKQKISALELSLLKEKIKLSENNYFIEEKSFSPEGIQARVLTKPPFSPYDTFMIYIDKEGIKEGDNVFAMGYFIGNISSVQGDSAIVKLKSSPNEITVIRVSNIDAEAVGRGGGRFTVTIPKDVEVKIGDVVTVPHLGVVIMGVITEIEENSAGSFNTLYFNLPISLSEIYFVTVVGS